MNSKEKKMTKLLVTGTVAVDSVETPFGSRDSVFGGSASYFSYSASFYSPVSLVAVVGEDFPDEYRSVLKEREINLGGLQVLPGKTFRWKGKYESDLNVAHTLDTELNVLQEFNPKLPEGQSVEYLFLANIDPDLQSKLIDETQGNRPKLIAMDTMNFWISSKREALEKVLSRVDLLVVNDGEARDLAQEPNLIKAGRMIQNMGPSRVIIKKGEHGVLLFDESKFLALPAYPLESVFDPTGAGDTFGGGLMGYLSKTDDLSFQNLKKAVAYATIMGSFVVEDFGLERMRRLKYEEIEERLATFRELSSF